MAWTQSKILAKPFKRFLITVFDSSFFFSAQRYSVQSKTNNVTSNVLVDGCSAC